MTAEEINPSQPQKPEVPLSQPQTIPVKPAETSRPQLEIVKKSFTRVPGEGESKHIGSPEMDRRSFIKWITIGWAAFAAILGGYGTMVLRFLFPNVLFEPKQSFRAGFP